MFPDTIKAPGSLTYPGDPAKIFKTKKNWSKTTNHILWLRQ